MIVKVDHIIIAAQHDLDERMKLTAEEAADN